jgi:hypothetical protein
VTILQLDPPLLFVTDQGQAVTAILVMDYGIEYETLFLVGFQESRELWWLPHSRLRMQDNISLGRMPRLPVNTEVPHA